MRYSIEGQELTDIADALRRKHGETREKPVYAECIVRNKNTLNLNHSGKSYTSDFTEIAKINGASYLKVKYKYNDGANQTFTINGEAAVKKTVAEIEIAGDTVTFVYALIDKDPYTEYFGYYAEIRGYDVDNNLILADTGETEEVPRTYQTSEMAQAIDDIPAGPPEEAFTVSGDCDYRFAYGGWDWFIDQHGHKITTKDITSASYMFRSSNTTEIPFDINFKNGGCTSNYMFGYCAQVTKIPSIDFKQMDYKDDSSLFNGCANLTEIGDIKNLYPSNISSLFQSCKSLRHVPNFINLNLSRIRTYAYSNCSGIFAGCWSLRSVPEDFLKQFYGIWTSGSYVSLSTAFYQCYSIDEIRGLNPQTGTMTSNIFGSYSSGTFANCNRVKNIIFAKQDDGTPYKLSWKNQTIDLSLYIGHLLNSAYYTYILDYNSGITADKEVIDDATYQALKDDPDWFTTKVEYSRYNHDSAVATINSLPDTSAYIAANGGTNTIKFKGTMGSATDGGAINTLTAEEIAVATSRGWTVTFV